MIIKQISANNLTEAQNFTLNKYLLNICENVAPEWECNIEANNHLCYVKFSKDMIKCSIILDWDECASYYAVTKAILHEMQVVLLCKELLKHGISSASVILNATLEVFPNKDI